MIGSNKDLVSFDRLLAELWLKSKSESIGQVSDLAFCVAFNSMMIIDISEMRNAFVVLFEPMHKFATMKLAPESDVLFEV